MQIKWPSWCKRNKSEAVQLASCGVIMMEHISCSCFMAFYPHFTLESSSCSSFTGAFSVHPDYFVWYRLLPVLIIWKMLSQLNIHLCISQPRPFCIGPAVWNNRSLPIRQSRMLMRSCQSQQLNNSYTTFIHAKYKVDGVTCIKAPNGWQPLLFLKEYSKSHVRYAPEEKKWPLFLGLYFYIDLNVCIKRWLPPRRTHSHTTPKNDTERLGENTDSLLCLWQLAGWRSN